MLCTPRTLAQSRVRDLADDGLHETELAALRRARVVVLIEYFLTNESTQVRLNLVRRTSRYRTHGRDRETVPGHGRVLHQRTFLLRKSVQARSDKCVQGLRNIEFGTEIADGAVRLANLFEYAAVSEHAHSLDGI